MSRSLRSGLLHPFSLKRRGTSSRFAGLLSDDATARLAAFLRRAHPVKTAEAVAAACGATPDAARKWLSGQASPGFGPLTRLIGAYGPALLAALYEVPPAWLDETRLKASHDEIGAEIAALHARLGDLLRGVGKT